MDLKAFQKLGQSVWLDYLRRNLIASGELARMVREDEIRGITTNPDIFNKAISDSTDYDAALERDVKSHNEPAGAIYERLVIDDIQRAADVLRPVFESSQARDGFVSMEVSPYVAHAAEATIKEARRLWKTIGRDNVMIKVPGTRAGFPAIEQLTREGVNVNITLLFGRKACLRVHEAYMAGLEARVARGEPIDRIASVASMFVSRVDVLVENVLHDRLEAAVGSVRAEIAGLLGAVGIANAKLAYEDWKQVIASPRWQALAARGARPQRLLWASTSTKSPELSDVHYVEALIGPDTVDTIPPKTLDAFRDHGVAADRLEEGLGEAHAVMDTLARTGISIDELADRLVEQGVQKFATAFDALLASVEKKRDLVLGSALDRTSYTLPEPLDRAVAETLEKWRVTGNIRRLWSRDATLWTDHGESDQLGWLGLVDHPPTPVDELMRFKDLVRDRGYKHAVLLGVGGSSLAAEVIAKTIGSTPRFPELIVLDSIDPEQIRAVEARIDITSTLFIVSSKSGTTLEPNLLADYFRERVSDAVGDAGARLHFIAITDAGTPLERTAENQHADRVWLGPPHTGGRYSALSTFGLVPGAVIGLDVRGFLERTIPIVRACAPLVPPRQNPGVLLGAVLGTLATTGRDKVTLVASPRIAHLGAWLEYLLAESTGKHDTGLVPIDREPLARPELYGADRAFVYLRLDEEFDPKQDDAILALKEAGHPVVRLAIASPLDIGQEFFRWEVAVSVAGSILGVNPFDQPDVEVSKAAARALTDAADQAGGLPNETPFCDDGGLQLFTADREYRALATAAAGDATLWGYLRAHLGRTRPGDFVALLAFIERSDAHEEQLQHIRCAIRDARSVATSVGFGPRFLHSTGQLFKGGPNTGVFLQVTCDDVHDVPVPGHASSFGVFKAAQARADLGVLAERGRRILRVHLGRDVTAGLNVLRAAIEGALS